MNQGKKLFLSLLALHPPSFFVICLRPLCLKDLALGDEVHKLLLTWSDCNPFPGDLHPESQTHAPK